MEKKVSIYLERVEFPPCEVSSASRLQQYDMSGEFLVPLGLEPLQSAGTEKYLQKKKSEKKPITIDRTTFDIFSRNTRSSWESLNFIVCTPRLPALPMSISYKQTNGGWKVGRPYPKKTQFSSSAVIIVGKVERNCVREFDNADGSELSFLLAGCSISCFKWYVTLLSISHCDWNYTVLITRTHARKPLCLFYRDALECSFITVESMGFTNDSMKSTFSYFEVEINLRIEKWFLHLFQTVEL